MSGAQTNTELRHERIMASAGSGKTFQLTNRYLRLILDGEPPQSILASTFTRLAAGEIRDRILERLAQAAQRDDVCSELVQHAGVAELTRTTALQRLVELTRQMHRMQVRTIDSFCAGIVRCFALELGLDPAAAVVDDHTEQQLRREAITRLLDERDPQPIIDLLRVLTEGSTERSVTESIDTWITTMYELYRDAPAEAWNAIQPAPMLTADDLAHALDALEPLAPDEDKRMLKAHADDVQRARQCSPYDYHGWLAFLKKGLAKALEDGRASFYNKPIPDNVCAAYAPIIRHARAVLRNSVVQRTQAMRDLLAKFHAAFVEVKAANKAMTFSDITWKLAEAEKLGTIDEICFRLDASLRHLLLDEMQDTSIDQWRALSPLVDEILSYAPPQRTFFCVGDVKQSIYAWREACPEILETLCDVTVDAEGNPVIDGSRVLAKSWRSSPVIMDAVNRILMTVADNQAMRECRDAAMQWDAVFAEHTTAKTSMPGYAELRTVRRADAEANERQREVRLRDAAVMVQSLKQQHPTASIGVLTRTNVSVNFLLYELGPSRLNVPNVAGRGGGALTDSAAVNVILDLLRLGDHPEHTVAAFNVMHSPLAAHVGLRSKADCGKVSQRVRRLVHEQGYAATIRRWVSEIGRFTDARQLRRLMQLQDLALEFDAAATLRCDDFVNMVESRKISEPTAAQVQVMTVHQSKGLEFDIVLLPDLQGELARGTPGVLYSRDGAAGPVTAIGRHLHSDVTSRIPELQAMADAQTQRKARESLCLLYVAMTRARHALHMMIDPPAENERSLPKTFAGLLRDALVEDDIEPESNLFELGDPAWGMADADDAAPRTDPATEDSRDRAAADDRIVLAPTRSDLPRGRAAAGASAHDDMQQSLALQLHLPHTESRDRGTAIHALFEQVTWLDDWVMDNQALTRVARAAAPRRDATWAESQVEAFASMIAQPTVKAALSRGDAGDETLRLYREYPFARRADGAVQRGYIDRLVARVVDDAVVDASIIDFKTDAIEADEAAARAEQYRPQLEAYRAAAAAALEVDEQRISMSLLFTTCGELVTL